MKEQTEYLNAEDLKKDIVIVGGGTAGITVAAMLRRQAPEAQVCLLDAAKKHYYQPAFTLVGSGDYKLEDTVRQEKDLIPEGVDWVQAYVAEAVPEQNLLVLQDGRKLRYQYLIMAPGIQLNWDAIPGLAETIGQNGVTSNYDPRYAPYTWELVQNLQQGHALFTQPATPIKCGGAPQKIMYMAEDHWRRQGVRNQVTVSFYTPGTVIFGVKKFAQTLQKIISERQINAYFYHELVAIDAEKREATFRICAQDTDCVSIEGPANDRNPYQDHTNDGKVVVKYDMLHLAPPMSAPDFIRNSSLAIQEGGPKGWMKVDKHSLQSPDFPNVFGIGDVIGVPTAKTGAAVRKQAPVLVDNLLKVRSQQQLHLLNGEAEHYQGYSSCPIVTRKGRMVLAEFDYNQQPDPSFPFDTSKERYSMWLLKKYFLPWMYWNRMLKGKP